uniref:Uncharacterized protein n=1 Tax=Glossina palpalis gambiensis TaxID=67801 RepID=A0A1B0BUB8_9MUSC
MDLKSENMFFPKIPSARKSPMPPSGSRQPDPYSMDDSTLLLPVFIAIGPFIPTYTLTVLSLLCNAAVTSRESQSSTTLFNVQECAPVENAPRKLI